MDDDRPLRLDAPREEALARAVAIVHEAWRSFDRFRPEEPPLDERIRELLRAGLPSLPATAVEVLEDAGRILDESIAQPRPRYFAFIGSSGLEIGAITASPKMIDGTPAIIASRQAFEPWVTRQCADSSK